MAGSTWRASALSFDYVRGDLTGAIGDTVTVLPIVVAVGVLTDLHLAVMLVWFGVFQVVWGVVYGVPLSVEPMKALAALLIAGSLGVGEFLLAGIVVSAVLIVIGLAGVLDRFDSLIPQPLVRGIQFAVALVLLERGLQLGLTDPALAGVAGAIALGVIALGYWNLSALVVLFAGGALAATQTGLPTITVPPVDVSPFLFESQLSVGALEASVAQIGMSVGNAAIATSLLLGEYFHRDVSPDDLSTSMGVMNLFALPLGGLPMCHGSGGVAGKFAFGARTTAANVILGAVYVGLAFGAVAIVRAYPFAMLGVILTLVALQLARTSFETSRYSFVAAVGVIGLLVNIGAALLFGVVAHQLLARSDFGGS